MRGHEPLIAMRLAKKRPRSVSVMLAKVAPWAIEWHKHPATEGDAVIEIEDKDNPATLDLRCLVGLDYVIVYGQDNDRTRSVAKACKMYAKRVIESCFDDLPRCYKTPRIEDTGASNG